MDAFLREQIGDSYVRLFAQDALEGMPATLAVGGADVIFGVVPELPATTLREWARTMRRYLSDDGSAFFLIDWDRAEPDGPDTLLGELKRFFSLQNRIVCELDAVSPASPTHLGSRYAFLLHMTKHGRVPLESQGVGDFWPVDPTAPYPGAALVRQAILLHGIDRTREVLAPNAGADLALLAAVELGLPFIGFSADVEALAALTATLTEFTETLEEEND